MNNKFLFLDLETTGLDPNNCVILEVAAIVTDNKLNILDKYTSPIKASPIELEKMDEWCKNTHTSSGLLKEVMETNTTISDVEFELKKLKRKHFPVSRPPLSGSSVHFDKSFLRVHTPAFDKELSHRIIDVSSFMGALGNYHGFTIENRGITSHRAFADIQDSIGYLKSYLERFK